MKTENFCRDLNYKYINTFVQNVLWRFSLPPINCLFCVKIMILAKGDIAY